eukprot:4754351-Pleurochrysis_carterae.AAC.2
MNQKANQHHRSNWVLRPHRIYEYISPLQKRVDVCLSYPTPGASAGFSTAASATHQLTCRPLPYRPNRAHASVVPSLLSSRRLHSPNSRLPMDTSRVPICWRARTPRIRPEAGRELDDGT